MAINVLALDVLALRAYCYVPLEKQVAINDFVYKVAAIGGTPTLNTVAAAFDDLVAPLYKNILTADAQYIGVDVRRIDPGPATQSAASRLNTGVGTVMGNMAPLQACGILSRYTDEVGPSGRGRIYFPFIPVGFLTSTGEIDLSGPAGTEYPAFITDVIKPNLSLTLGIGDFTDGNMGIFGNPIGAPPPFFKPFTRCVIQTKVATQKRRGDYGRLNLI